MFGEAGPTVGGHQLVERGSSYFSDAASAPAVGALLSNDQPTVELVLGAMSAGTTLVSLPFPGRAVDLAAYVRMLAASSELFGLSEIVVADELAALLEGTGLRTRRHSSMRAAPLAAPSPAGFSLVQFTSGSTKTPKPVVLSDARLGANLAAILAIVRPRPGDGLVSWLPLAHDMGLVGMLLTGLAAGAPQWAGCGTVVLLDPRTFLKRPAIWLEAVGAHGGSFTAAPDFAFRMVARRKISMDVDLSVLRCVIVGGEIVRADTLTDFAAAFGAHGFNSLAFCPAYGMAEVGVAATLTPPEMPWRETVVATAGLADLEIRDPSRGESVSTLVASGPALPGYRVAVDAIGRSERVGAMDAPNGQIMVSGPSIGEDGVTGEFSVGGDGWYRTGDIGFLRDGWLYVCGRHDDYLVANGRNVYAPAVEGAIGQIKGVRSGRATAVGLPSGEWVIVVELSEPLARTAESGQLRQEVRKAAVDAVGVRPDDVLFVAPGSLPLTSSGKLQRNEVRARLLKGELAGVVFAVR